MICESFCESSFDASHQGAFADEIHGHTWFVRIYWLSGPVSESLIDAGVMFERLTGCLSEWDHSVLDGKVDPTNEGIAAAVGQNIAGLSRVKVWREGRLPCGAYWINSKGGRSQSPAPREAEDVSFSERAP